MPGRRKSPPGRPKGEYRSAQREGTPVSPPGRPKGEYRSAQREGTPVSPPGRPKGEYRSAQREGTPVSPPGRPKGEYRSAQREGAPVTAGAAWFSRVGTPLARGDRDAIAGLLLSAAEPPRVGIRGLAHWHEVGAVIRAADWDDAGEEREEEERQRLWQAASERIDEDALLRQLTAATDALAGALHEAAAIAAAREGSADAALVRAAAQAALMAVHQSELAGLAGEGAGHFFVLRRALFERGRWPLGTYRGQYLVF